MILKWMSGFTGGGDMGVMQNYFEIQVWQSLRNAIQNGHREQVMEGDILELAIELCDYDADIEKYVNSGKFDINSVIHCIEQFREYSQKIEEAYGSSGV